MDKKAKPLIIVGAFWFAAFLFAVAGYSGSFNAITGFAVSENPTPDAMNLQGLIIVVLFFTNLVTMFFLIRQSFE